MAKLIKKAWTFRPNAYTTVFSLTATFANGETSVYSYRKVDVSWEPVGTHDTRLAIMLPSRLGGAFIVRSYENDPYTSITPSYANEHTTVESEPVNLLRISFPVDEYDNNAPFYHFTNNTDKFMWDLFNQEDLYDRYITNLTDSVEVPQLKVPDGFANYYGWGLLNETCPVEKMSARSFNPATGEYVMYMPVSDEIPEISQGFPVINAQKLANIMQQPCVNSRYVLLPLIKSTGMVTWWEDTKDYREEDEQ